MNLGTPAPDSCSGTHWRALIASCVLAGFLVLLAWAWLPFGLDHFDQGYVLSAAGLLLPHPEEVVPMKTGGLWLALLPVALLLKLGGDYGALLVRLASIPVALTATAAGCYLVRERTSLPFLILAGAFSHLVARSWRVDVFLSYPLLSAFFFALATVLLVEGGRRARLALVFAGGALLGANVFLRLPNVIGLSLVVLPAGLELLTERRGGVALRRTVWALLGALVGVATVLLVMIVLGHAGLYLEALADLGRMAGARRSPYEPRLLLVNMALDTLMALVFMVEILILAVLGECLARAHRFSGWAIALVVAGGWLGGAIVLSDFRTFVFVPFALILVTLVVSLLRPNASALDRLIDAGALGTFLLVPVGAAAGIETGAAPGALFAGPIAAVRVAQAIRSQGEAGKGKRRETRIPIGAVGAAIVAVSLLVAAITHLPLTSRGNSGWGHPYASLSARRLPGILLDLYSASMYDELLPAIERHSDGDDFLLAYPHIPLIYFLAERRSYLGETWPSLRTPEFVRQRLEWAETHRDALPLVVRAPAHNLNFKWPSRSKKPRRMWLVAPPKWLDEYHSDVARRRDRALQYLGFTPLKPMQRMMIVQNVRLLDQFLRDNRYETVWTGSRWHGVALLAPARRDPERSVHPDRRDPADP